MISKALIWGLVLLCVQILKMISCAEFVDWTLISFGRVKAHVRTLSDGGNVETIGSLGPL